VQGTCSLCARAHRAAEKDAKQSEESKKIAELAAPPERQVLTVKKYANTNFINIMVENSFYMKLEKAAEKLGTTPEVLIYNALLLILKKLEETKQKLEEP
jgi:hypothetical protein